METEERQTPASTEPPHGSEPERYRRARGLGWVVLALMVINGAVVYQLMNGSPRKPAPDLVIAEQFLDGLQIGNAGHPNSPGSGFEVAYELLSEEKQSGLSFEEFVFYFVDLSDEIGFLDSYRRDPKERGNVAERTIRYKLTFSGTRGVVKKAGLELVLAPQSGVDVIRVASFDLVDDPREGR